MRWGRGKVLLCCLAALVCFVAVTVHHRHSDEALYAAALRDDDAIVEGQNHSDNQHRVYRRRIARNEIPALNYNNINYRTLFNDSNYVQLSAARAIGIDPSTVGDPAENDALVPIFSTALYRVDTMYHSVPYLMPETVLLLDYIAHRFKSLMAEHYPSIGEHNVILTSALRTEQSERNLRRVNRNATDTSCHIYGTTFDLSAQRYLHVASGHDTVVDACKQMLALALYELRYEGLCYVKYERGSCFHITLRTTQYEGSGTSETRSYVNPGSPDYLLTKAPPRPKPSARSAGQPAKKAPARQRTTRKQRHNTAGYNGDVKKESAQKNGQQSNHITERERMSLEQFERRNY
jgi:hypothetical protein